MLAIIQAEIHSPRYTLNDWTGLLTDATVLESSSSDFHRY